MRLPVAALANATGLASNLTTVRIPNLVEQNATALQAPPSQENYIACDRYYGVAVSGLPAYHMISMLPRGAAQVDFLTGDAQAPHHLPFTVSRWDLTISVDIAGPRRPSTVQIAPDTIREMAKHVIGKCLVSTRVGGPIGGVMALGLEGLKDFVRDPTLPLHDLWPLSTAFVTVAVHSTAIVQQIGNYEPETAGYCRGIALAAALAIPQQSDMKQELLYRAERFLLVFQRMLPRFSDPDENRYTPAHEASRNVLYPFWRDPYSGVDGPGGERLPGAFHRNISVETS